MGEYTRIYDRFKGHTAAECDCICCLHYDPKRKRCPLPRCCCEEERTQAICREQLQEAGIAL